MGCLLRRSIACSDARARAAHAQPPSRPEAIQERCPVLLGAGVGLTHVDEVLSAVAVVMARDGVWATVLEEQAAAVGKAFPEWAEAARRAAEQGRQPVADARVGAELLSTFGGWVEQALDHVMTGS